MIQANELRIGNWINYIPDGIDFVVSEIDCFNTLTTVNGLDTENINPIPLTPEILEKCGFEKHNPSCYIKKYSNQGELTLFSSDTPVGIANNFESNSFHYAFNHIEHIIKYLHQLQNLYYALTQTELQIQL